jgi:signal transduction histidine kinase
MNADPMTYVTAGLYWCLILCWLIILIFYWREHRRLTALSPMVGTMLVVVFLDGARTLLESVYFGTWYTARTGLIPRDLYDILAEPQYVILPKLLNLMAALTIIGVLVRRWFPNLAAEMERQRRTEQLYAELQEAHEELKATQETRDALSHMIVHDMRTPLTSVITGLQTIRHPESTAELTRELVDGALAGSNRLLLMVNDLLDISKMEAGEMTPKRECFPVGDVMAVAVEMVGALARDRRLELRQETAFGEENAGIVEADRELTRRIVVNLLGNALKFTPAGGTILLRAASEADGMVCISVSDTGPGIAPKHQARIFDKFYHVQPGAAVAGASTGLGLTFCKMAVEAQGGRIGVDSEPGRGSRFWFTLPTPSMADRTAAGGSASGGRDGVE